MESLDFVVVAFGILAFGLISGRVQTSVITAPMVFVAFGLLVGPWGLALVEFDVEKTLIHTLAELTLVLILFTDASRIDLALLRREHDLPIRLLTVGLPLTIVLGAALGAVMFDALGFWGAAVLAAILAPTDAALGHAVVSIPRLPVRIRQTLNVESGLNDGIALPLILILISVAAAARPAGEETVGFWLRFAAMQVVLGPLVGIGVGYLVGKSLERARRAGWVNDTFLRLSALGLALLAFALAELVGGNGFIAAFAAGLTMGNSARSICASLYEFGEAEGQLLTLLVFMVFGAVMVPDALDRLDRRVLLYALLSLTVVRMVPVAVSLLGARLSAVSVMFVGWFGPRGVASILFGLLVLEESGIAMRDEILIVVTTTVLLSVFAHGLSAFPAARWYARRCEATKHMPDVAEHAEVTEMPVRLRSFGSPRSG